MEINWTIVGVITGVLALVVGYLQLIRTPRKKKIDEDSQKNLQFLTKSKINASPVNSIQGDKVNFNQTIINNVRENIKQEEIKEKKSTINIPKFERAKKKIVSQKAWLRTYIYAVFASAKSKQLHSKLEVRHIQDIIEELIGVKDIVTLEELKLMKEENIIDFGYKDYETYISPYTKIILTSKFYSEIL